MTIRNRFYLLIGLVVMAMLVMGGLNRYAAGVIIELEQEEVQLVEAEVGMLLLRRHEKDFMQRLEMQYVAQFDTDHAALIELANDLIQRLEASGIDASNTRKLVELLNSYGADFHALASHQQRIGLHEEDGLYGSLRSAVHAVEDLLRAEGHSGLLAEMLMLRRHEKDFMLRGKLPYVDKFDRAYAAFVDHVAASDLPDETKAEVDAKVAQYRTDFQALLESYKVRGLSESDGLHGRLRDTIHQVEALIHQLHEEIIAAAEHHIGQVHLWTLASGLLLTLIMAGVLVWLSRAILKPVNGFAATMHRAAGEHDLTLRAEASGKCEIGAMARAFNGMMDEFQGLLRQVTASSGQVSDASGQLAEVTASTMSSVQQQRVESDQVATAMNQMAATVQEVAGHAVNAADASANADAEAGKGTRVVAQSVEGIQSLARAVESTAATIGELEQESNNIGTVLSVITGIAEQTNLLALNAAIEAARAGEQGRGFAVVADEVRTLAQRSQASTEEIKSIIDRLQTKAQAAVQAMESGRSQAQVSVEQAEQAGASLRAIADAIVAIRDMNTQIASAAEEQSAVAEEINQSVVRIAQAAENSAVGAEQTTRTSGELAGLAGQLQERVSAFRLQ